MAVTRVALNDSSLLFCELVQVVTYWQTAKFYKTIRIYESTDNSHPSLFSCVWNNGLSSQVEVEGEHHMNSGLPQVQSRGTYIRPPWDSQSIVIVSNEKIARF